jgi:hypothetical protein
VRESVALADYPVTKQATKQSRKQSRKQPTKQPSKQLEAKIETTDELDQTCLHWQAKSPEGQVIGSIRMTSAGAKIVIRRLKFLSMKPTASLIIAM